MAIRTPTVPLRFLTESEVLSILVLLFPEPAGFDVFEHCCKKLNADYPDFYGRLQLLRQQEWVVDHLEPGYESAGQPLFVFNGERILDFLQAVPVDVFEGIVAGLSDIAKAAVNQAEFITAALNYRQKAIFPKEGFMAKNAGLNKYFESMRTALLDILCSSNDWVLFFRRLPCVFALICSRRLCVEAKTQGLSQKTSERVLRLLITGVFQMTGEKELDATREILVFYADFLHNGKPQEVLRRLDPEGKYAYAVLAARSMSSNEPPATAVNLMRKALFLEGRKRYFEEDILNWFYGIALLRDKANPETASRIRTILDIKNVQTDVNLMRKALFLEGRKRYFEEDILNWFYGIALLRDKANPETASRIRTILDIKNVQTDIGLRPLWLLLSTAAGVNVAGKVQSMIGRVRRELLDMPTWYGLFSIAALKFQCIDRPRALTRFADDFFSRYPLLRIELEAIKDARSLQLIELTEAFDFQPLLPAGDYGQADWELALTRLMNLEKAPEDALPTADALYRVVYFLNRRKRELEIRLQKSSDGKRWSAGALLSLETFRNGVAGMTEQDHRVASLITTVPGHRNQLKLEVDSAIVELVGCPHLYDRTYPGKDDRLEVVEEKLQVCLKRCKDHFEIRTNMPGFFNPETQRRSIHYFAKQTRIEVYRPTDKELALLKELKRRHSYPLQAQEQLQAYLGAISTWIAVVSDIEPKSELAETVPADARICFSIKPENQNCFYLISSCVRPVPDSDFEVKPGKGEAYVAQATKGSRVQVCRDLKLEKRNLQILTDKLPANGGDSDWGLDLFETLTFLDSVNDHKDLCQIFWPQGVKLRVSPQRIDNVVISIPCKDNDTWFDVGGCVMSPGVEAKLQDLLAENRFVRLNETDYAAVSQFVRQKIQALNKIGVVDSGDGNLRLSKYNADRLQDLDGDGLVLEVNDEFNDVAERIRNINLSEPEIPANLNARLRDYQVQGFKWLVKVSDWGAGAILADDMGLGKTVQTIAFLLRQADKGPQLVVVPTVVVVNWVTELARFAPRLYSVVYSSQPKEKRTSVFENLKSGDVVIVSYGMLANDIDAFAKVQWATLVLDEAHAVKNPQTKNFKAVKTIKAGTRILLTGTPLQNHLTDLWSLMEIANPGMLGKYAHFHNRFALPIETRFSSETVNPRDMREQLQRMLAPFVLRRTKAEVLNELPTKTEITLTVELSQEEQEVYEYIRKQVVLLDTMEALNATRILMELTRLRLACCSPVLVSPELKDIASSKTAVFKDLATDLVGQGHRALVFSQFTKHLALIKTALDEIGIDYLYLDGTMTAMERAQVVEEFETGSTPI
ncbi:MAG: DEAD/DEAH box helicase, partial [Sutterellaceae bacterium]|nr:DEAD/DEAH box helicase [Sutterellaceae bacterium]